MPQNQEKLEQVQNNIDAKEDVVDDLGNKIDDTQAQVNLLLTQQKYLNAEISNAEQQIGVISAQLTSLSEQIAATEKYTAKGKDTVSFLFSANGDKKLNLLQKAASGGELSRIMLCLKSLMAEYTGMPTMIFDEIDTGVSGSIADKMGALIGRMGERMQIFAITHLPQIASPVLSRN